MASNIIVPGGNGINTNGFTYGKLGYSPGPVGLFGRRILLQRARSREQWWFDGKYAFSDKWLGAVYRLARRHRTNSGQSYIGKVDSQVFGAQLGFNVTHNLQITAGYDNIPWKNRTVNLPSGVTCSNTNNQISAKANFAYFLPLNAAQCYTNANGTTQIEYGGWASPYTDNYDSDPLFTTSTTQGMADRRAAGFLRESRFAVYFQ